jgi:hypothetical protein
MDEDELEEFEAAMNPGAPGAMGMAAGGGGNPQAAARNRQRLRGVRLALRLLLFVFVFGHAAPLDRFVTLCVVACIAWLWQTRRLEFLRGRFTGAREWVQNAMMGEWGYMFSLVAAIFASLHPEAMAALRERREAEQRRVRELQERLRAEAEAAAAAAAAGEAPLSPTDIVSTSSMESLVSGSSESNLSSPVSPLQDSIASQGGSTGSLHITEEPRIPPPSGLGVLVGAPGHESAALREGAVHSENTPEGLRHRVVSEDNAE